MRREFLIVVLLLLPTPSWAQASLLSDVQKERAKYGEHMTATEVGQLLNAVAWAHRTQGWGLLQKGSGNAVPLAGVFVSGDTLVYGRGQTEHFDVLIDWENTAKPTWSSNGPCVLSDHSGCDMKHFFAPVDPGNPPPPPPPPPPPSVNLQKQIDALVAENVALKARLNAADQKAEDADRRLNELAVGLQGNVDGLKRVDQYLSDKPIPKTCHASAFGMPVGCKLEP
jgi:hypothetical protein